MKYTAATAEAKQYSTPTRKLIPKDYQVLKVQHFLLTFWIIAVISLIKGIMQIGHQSCVYLLSL